MTAGKCPVGRVWVPALFVLLISKCPKGCEGVSRGSQGCHKKVFFGICLFVQPQRLCPDPF